jgi:tetratricopeptide (TPR) repeat protein
LRAVSVAGQEFAFDDALGLVRQMQPATNGESEGDPRWSEDEVEAALLQAAEAGIVRERSPEHYAFNHALTQQTLYSELSTRKRKRLHLAAGRALERLDERARERRAGELAWHFLEGDDPQQALPYALLAGSRAEAVFANGDAEHHYRTSWELAHELSDSGREADALEGLGRVLTVGGRYDKALEYLDQAVKVCQQIGDLEREAWVLAQVGQVHFLRRTRTEGISRLRPMVEAMEGGEPSYGQAALWASLARLYMDMGDDRLQLEAAERAIELAKVVPDRGRGDHILLSAELTRSDALFDLGQEEESLHSVEKLIPRAEEAGDLDNLTRALANAAFYYSRRGDLERDRIYHERMLELAERRGDRGHILMGAMALNQNAYLLGDWRRSHEYLDRADAAIQNMKVKRLRVWPVAARAWLAFREGDLPTAARLAEQAGQIGESHGQAEYKLLADRLLAEMDLVQAIGEEAAERSGQAFARLVTWLDDPAAQADSGFLRTVAWAYIETGNALAAREAAVRGVAAARKWTDRPELVEALVVHGMVAARADEWAEAEGLLSEALAFARSMPFPFGEGRALVEWGVMQSLRGENEPARDRLEEALWIFQRLDAQPDMARVRNIIDSVEQTAPR